MFVDVLLLFLLSPLLLLLLLLLLRAAAVDAGEHEGCEGSCVTWCGKSMWAWTTGVGCVETESTQMPGEVTMRGRLKEASLEVKVAVWVG